MLGHSAANACRRRSWLRPSLTLELDPAAMEEVAARATACSFGFTTEEFGPRAIVVGIPMLLPTAAAKFVPDTLGDKDEPSAPA